ncbi:hypothetical protein AALA54_07725 [Oscillospiraceae bacterium 44-34]
MKEIVKTSRLAGQLEKLFNKLNSDFFNGELQTPVITIQSTPRAYGHYSMMLGMSKVKGAEKSTSALERWIGRLSTPPPRCSMKCAICIMTLYSTSRIAAGAVLTIINGLSRQQRRTAWFVAKLTATAGVIQLQSYPIRYLNGF